MPNIDTIETKFIPRLFILAIFLMPLTRIGALEVGVTIKVSEILFGITFLLWVYTKFKKQDFSFIRTPLDYPLVGLIIASAISLIAAINLLRGGAYWVWTVFSIIAIFYLSVNILSKSEKVFKMAISAFSLSAFIVILFGFYQFFGDYLGLITGLRPEYTYRVFGFPRMQSTLLEPLYFGNYLLTIVPIQIALFISGFAYLFKSRKLSIVFITLGLTSMVLSFSRGTWAGIIVSVFSIFFLFFATWFIKRIRFKEFFDAKNFITFFPVIVFLALTLSLGMISLGSYLSTTNIFGSGANITVDEAVESALDKTENLGQGFGLRVKNYIYAWELFTENPVIGVGIGNFGPTLKEKTSGLTDFPAVNNVHLEILSETGLLGFFFYVWLVLALVVSTLWTLVKMPKNKVFWIVILVGLISTYAGVFVQQMTYSTLNITFFWFLLALIISAQKLSNKV